MDPFSEALAIISVVNSLLKTANNLVAAGKLKGDPTPEELIQGLADAQSANNRLHLLAKS